MTRELPFYAARRKNWCDRMRRGSSVKVLAREAGITASAVRMALKHELVRSEYFKRLRKVREISEAITTQGKDYFFYEDVSGFKCVDNATPLRVVERVRS